MNAILARLAPAAVPGRAQARLRIRAAAQQGYMTPAALYRYPTQHFGFHQRQLTLSPAT